MSRAVRRCASKAGPSRPFDTKLVLCRIILMSSNQGGACGAAGPASAAASGLGRSRPPHAGPRRLRGWIGTVPA